MAFLMPDDAQEAEPAAQDADTDQPNGKKRKRRPRKGKRQRKYRGNAITGDDLGGPGVKNLGSLQGGGEEQLLGHEIEAGFDQAFPKIRRCLMLVESEDPVVGKLTFGLRIAGSGQITKVNIRGPAAVTRSEAGSCMRQAAKGIRFRSFNGPDMLVQFPITLE